MIPVGLGKPGKFGDLMVGCHLAAVLFKMTFKHT